MFNDYFIIKFNEVLKKYTIFGDDLNKILGKVREGSKSSKR